MPPLGGCRLRYHRTSAKPPQSTGADLGQADATDQLALLGEAQEHTYRLAMRGRARAREALGADHLDDAGEHRGAGGRLRGDCENAFDELKTRAPSGDLALGVECGEAVCNWVGWSRPA